MKVYLVDGWRTSVEYVIALPISLLSGKKVCGATYLGGITEAVRKARGGMRQSDQFVLDGRTSCGTA